MDWGKGDKLEKHEGGVELPIAFGGELKVITTSVIRIEGVETNRVETLFGQGT